MDFVEQYKRDNQKLLAKAREFISNRTEVKVYDLQRRFLIGYTKASVLMDTLHEHGYVDSYEACKPGKVLI
jgi:DNA segregation ATPase FtsK/SpoIIIE-like protein